MLSEEILRKGVEIREDASRTIRARLKTSAALLLLSLAACAAPPVTPPVAVPAEFSASGAAVLAARWWSDFNDPTLTTLIERALQDNLSLRGVWDRLDQAEAIARREGAPLWPALDATAGAARVVQDTQTSTAGVRETNPRTELALGLIASYELDVWGRVRSTRDAARLDAQASAADLHAAAITLSAQVAATWYGLVEQYGQIDLLEQQLHTNEEVLELVTLRFRRGQVGAVDVLQQRQLVEQRRGELVTARSRAGVLEHQLAILLGQPPQQSVAPRVAELAPLPPLPATGLPADLIQRRPDLQAAQYAVRAADRRVAAAIAERFPRISLTASADTFGENVRDLFDNWLATLAASLVAPVFDAGQRQAEADRARAVAAERLHEYGQSVLVALGEVEDALVQERQQAELIASLEKQLVLSQLAIERTRDNYLQGTVDYLRVLSALLPHQALQRDALQARRELIGFRINLCRALGGGWELATPAPPAEPTRPAA